MQVTKKTSWNERQFPTGEDLKNRKPIPEACKGCNRTEEIEGKELCKLYLNPSIWWREGNPYFWKCPLATHYNPETNVVHKRLNPLKESKLRIKGGLRLGYKLRRYVHSKNYTEGVTDRKKGGK